MPYFFSSDFSVTFQSEPHVTPTMNLVIDQGNTRCKLALFEQAGEPIRETDLPVLDQAGLQAFLDGDKPDAAILSTVKHVEQTVIDAAKARVGHCVHFDASTPQPLRIH